MRHGHDRPASNTPTANLVTEAMSTTVPDPDSDLVPVDPDPAHLVTVRIVLVVEAVLLVALGVWGLVAALTHPHAGASGPPVLLFHITWRHAVLLLATALIALVGTRGHSWALRAMTVQAVGYAILFIVGAGYRGWFSDPADDVLHAFLALLALALLLWTASRALTDLEWVRRPDGQAPDGDRTLPG